MRIIIPKWYSKFDNGWKLCSYQTKSNGYDELSHRLHDFKENKNSAVKTFTKWSINELSNVLPELKVDYCIRALGRSELTATTTSKPLHQLAESIASHFEIEFIPELIAKKRATEHLVKLNKAEREEELGGVFYINLDKNLKGKSILLVDDIRTSGTTSNLIREVITEQFEKVKCYLFVLAQTNDGENPKEVIEKYSEFSK